MAGVSESKFARSRGREEEIFLIGAFSLLITFYLAYRLNRDEDIIVNLKDRVEQLENLYTEKKD